MFEHHNLYDPPVWTIEHCHIVTSSTNDHNCTLRLPTVPPPTSALNEEPKACIRGHLPDVYF